MPAVPTETPAETPADPVARPTLAHRLGEAVDRVATSRLPIAGWSVLVLVGLGFLVAGTVPVGPEWFGDVGAVAVSTAYAWALAARTGGRAVVFGTLAAVLGVVVVVVDDDLLRTGAAVLTCAVSAVLAVMVTVPAVHYLQAVRECLVAVAVAAVGALATVGFAPAITVIAFEYTTFGIALAGALVVVFRLGAGLHGLGRRGLAAVVVGGLLVVATLTYAELLRRYGATGPVDTGLDLVRESRERLGAFPRPILTVLGVPALVWGVHMRARRRQGWWVCAFGVAATVTVAHGLANPMVSIREALLSVVYGVVIGLVIGWVLVRLDLALTGGGGKRRSGGGGRRVAEEEATAVRPEPPRTAPLF